MGIFFLLYNLSNAGSVQNDFIYCLYVFVCVNNVICSQVELSFFFHAYNRFNYFTTDTLFYGLTDVLLSSGRLASLVKLFWRGVILSLDTI